MNEDILVSVTMITFNHSKYIAKAIESVLMQECNFKFELLIGDDCSSDETRSIVSKYQEQFPDIVKPIFYKNNVGGTRNSYELFMRAKGKYIALLEGDDLWCDKNKLQKQFDFLENNFQYAGCGCDFRYIHENGELFFEERERRMKQDLYADGNVYTLKQFNECKLPSQTGTLFFRNIFQQGIDGKIMYEAHRMIGDFTQILLILTKGNIYKIPEYMAYYRYSEKTGSSWSASEISNPYNSYDRFMYYIRLEKYAYKTLGVRINLRSRKVFDIKTQTRLYLGAPTYAKKKAVREMLKAEWQDK